MDKTDIRDLTRSINRLGGTFTKVARGGIGFTRTLETLGDFAEITASIINTKMISSVAKLGTEFKTLGGDAETVAATVAEWGDLSVKAAGGASILGISLGTLVPIVIALGAGFIVIKVAIFAVKTGFAILKKGTEVVIAVFRKLFQIGTDLVKSLFAKLVSVLGRLKDAFIDLVRSGVRRLIDAFRELSPEMEGISYDFERLTDTFSAGSKIILEAMRVASSGMVADRILMQQWNKAALGVGVTFAETLPQALIYFGRVSMATGESIDYLLTSYVKGVQKLSPIILDNLGIQVSVNEARQQAAVLFEKQIDLLTRAETQVGMYTIVLNKLGLAYGELPGPMGTLVQKIGMIDAKFINLKDTLTMTFLPAAKAVADLIYAIMDALEGSGTAFKYISAAITVVAEELTKLVNIGSTAIDGFKNTFTDKLIATASAALEWGAKIAINLAIGIVEGGGRALIGAINWISNILEKWLAPGSAPLVAPDLLKWGASTFTEWLRGFQDADFDVLETVQSPLLRALRIMTGDGEFGESFAEITEAMAAHIAGSSSLESALAALTSVGGEYGNELAVLYQRMLSVVSATDAVNAAEKRLADAQNRYKRNREALIEGAREYNKLLRSGADQATLAAKMAQLKTNYKNMKAAEKQVEEEETALDIAKEQLKIMKEQASAQERLLNQLLKMAEIAMPDGDGADGDGGGIFPGLPDFPDVTSIGATIDEVFDEIYARVRARMEEIWAMVVQTWEDSEAGQVWARLLQTWRESELKVWLEDFIIDISESGLQKALSNLWKKLSVAIQNWLDSKNSWWAHVWRVFTQKGIDDGTGEVDLKAALKVLWSKTFVEMKEGVSYLVFRLGFFIGEKMAELSYSIGEQLARLFFNLYQDVELRNINKEGGWGLAESFWYGLWAGMVSVHERKIEEFKQMLRGFFAAAVQEVLTFLRISSPSGVFADIGSAIVDGLVQGINNKFLLPKEALLGAINNAIESLRQINLWQIGRNLIDGLIAGLSGAEGSLKWTFNAIIWRIEQAINNVIYGINQLIYRIMTIPGTPWIPYLGYVGLPRLHEGGMITGDEQLALLRGQEVVIPLDDPRTAKVLSKALSDARPSIEIHNHFGRDSVRSDSDIDRIADAMQKRIELRGVRSRI